MPIKAVSSTEIRISGERSMYTLAHAMQQAKGQRLLEKQSVMRQEWLDDALSIRHVVSACVAM